MTSILRLASGLLAAASLSSAWAQPVSSAVPKPAASAASAATAKARNSITVIEDDNTRIEETHGRNGVKQVTVRSKVAGAKAYEIHVAPAGRDPSQERGNAGRPGWSILNF